MNPHRVRQEPAAQEPPPGIKGLLGWAVVRTALSLFAAGWILIQAASALLLGLGHWASELEPAAAQVLNLLFTLAYGVGVVYFLTGMGMACAVPAESGARRAAWGIVACLALSAAGWVLWSAASYQNREVLQEIAQEIDEAQKKNPKAGPPTKAELERQLAARQWGPDVLKALTITFVGGLCLAKLLFSGFLWAVARYLREQVLASGLVIYLLAEALGVAVVVSVLLRPAGKRVTTPLALFGGNWYAVGAASAFCTWFLVNLFLVRRALTRWVRG
jgi:hypothetical protein